MGRITLETYGKEAGCRIEPEVCTQCKHQSSCCIETRLRKAAQAVYQAPEQILLPPGVKAAAVQTRTRRQDSELQILLPMGVSDDEDEEEEEEDGDREILLPPQARRQ